MVHVFVMSRVDYCNGILSGASKSTTEKLQRVMNATARVVSDTRKYDRGLTNLLHDELHWLDVREWVQYKLCATVHRCLQHKAPQYMMDCCINISESLLVSSTCGPPAAVSCLCLNTGVRCSVVGPFLWLARWPGTRYQTIFEIRHILLTVFVAT